MKSPSSIKASNNGGQISIALKFENMEEAGVFANDKLPQALKQIVQFGSDGSLIIPSSQGQGTAGCYMTASGEIAINFGAARDALQYDEGRADVASFYKALTKSNVPELGNATSLQPDQLGFLGDRSTALYFNVNLVQPGRTTELSQGLVQQTKPKYKIIMSEAALAEIKRYKQELSSRRDTPGKRLNDSINKQKGSKPLSQFIAGLDDAQFIELLLSSKKPKIYAEATEFSCNKAVDWSGKEFALLGKITISMDAKAYDNGQWTNPEVFAQPSDVHLSYTGAPLLVNKDGQNPEYNQVVKGGVFDQEAYTDLVREKLLPNLLEINRAAGLAGKKAICTIPGWGVGQFAGDLGSERVALALKEAVATILTENQQNLGNIELVHMGLSRHESRAEQTACGNIKFRVRNFDIPGGKTQLCKPEDYQEAGDNFSNYFQAKIVAADHISYTGNDAFVGSRWTDEGVSGFATNTMEIVTNIEGSYDPRSNEYLPPAEMSNRTWGQIVEERDIKYIANENNIEIYHNDGRCTNIKDVDLPTIAAIVAPGVIAPIPSPVEALIDLQTLKEAIIENAAETITRELFGDDYAEKGHRKGDKETIKEIVALAVKDQSVSDFEINKNTESKISEYIKGNFTEKTLAGRFLRSGGIQLKVGLNTGAAAQEIRQIIEDEAPKLERKEKITLGQLSPGSTPKAGGAGTNAIGRR